MSLRLSATLPAALLVAFTAFCALNQITLTAAEDSQSLNVPPAGFTAIFNGKDLAGWRGGTTVSPLKRLALPPKERAENDKASVADIHKHWRVENGELVNDGNGMYLTTDKDYGDFELRLEYKTVAKADSGIYLRGIPQVQIWDYTKEGGKFDRGADKGSGGLYNNPASSPGKLPLVLADKPFGEWNSFRITMIGDNVTVYLNDKLVVDNQPLANYYEKGKPPYAVGPIQLQTHGGEIRWRNVFLREIPRPLPKDGKLSDGKPTGQGWKNLLAGDLSGWKYSPEYWKLTDGVLVGDYAGGPKHEYLCSEKAYGDFELHATVKMTGEGANSGVCIRTKPTDTDNVPGYQVDMGPGFWGCLWDERGDGMVDKCPDDVANKLVHKDGWNDYFVIARGHHIEAWLNGVKTIDTIHPRGNETGSLAFQLCHGKKQTRVEVKDLWVRELE
jgi:hypothetical protein